MASVATNDQDAVRELYGRFLPMLVSIASRSVGPDEAEDIAEDSLIAAWLNASSYDARKAKLSTWIGAIARRKTVDAWRRIKSRIAMVPLGQADGATAIHQFHDDDNWMDTALGKMNDTQRERFGLFSRGATYEALALMDGVPVGTVKSSLHAGRKKAMIVNPSH